MFILFFSQANRIGIGFVGRLQCQRDLLDMPRQIHTGVFAPRRLAIMSRRSPQIRPDGCVQRDFRSTIPANIAPGLRHVCRETRKR